MSTLIEQIGLRNTGPGTYAASWHHDFSVGPVMFGGAIAATIFHTAQTHLKTDTQAVKLDQPDIYKLHIQFLRPGELSESSLTVKSIKLGALMSTFQVNFSQGDKLRCLALVTAGNFDKSKGPTMKGDLNLLHPPPTPKPDFVAIEANRAEENWLAVKFSGDIIPVVNRLLTLVPKRGNPILGVTDVWYKICEGDKERFHSTFIALMGDILPSMSDTLLRNGGVYDGETNIRRALQFATENPDVIPASLENSLQRAMSSDIFNSTVTMDLEFRRKIVPEEGLDWVFVRTTADRCVDGRMFVENQVYDQDLEMVCLSKQFITVLEVGKKFKTGKTKSSL